MSPGKPSVTWSIVIDGQPSVTIELAWMAGNCLQQGEEEEEERKSCQSQSPDRKPALNVRQAQRALLLSPPEKWDVQRGYYAKAHEPPSWHPTTYLGATLKVGDNW